jgi:thioredoxin reductase (NADPH)
MIYDVIIIGAGPIGMACGLEAKKAELNYLIIDKAYLVNSLYHYPQSMTFFSTADKLEIGGIPFISQNTKPTRSEALEYYRKVCLHHDLNLNLHERFTNAKKEGASFTISTDTSNYCCSHLILATGFYDLENKMNIPGEELSKVSHYYQDPHPYFGRNVAIIGAANSAVDAALELWRKGAKEVTMIIREHEISPRVKYWVRPDIVNRIAEGSIKAYFNSRVTHINESEISFEQNGKSRSLKNDAVLALTGYRPDFELLSKIGLQFSSSPSHKPLYNELTMESNITKLFLAGVICGGLETNKWFIENSRVHAQLIINAITESQKNLPA